MSGILCNMAYSQDGGPNFQPASFQSNTWLQASQAVPPSPQAASLGRFGNLSVNYYSGSPGIDVPVYSLAGKYVQMPVALSYDANAVQVVKLPSWTGMGWTLQAGGVITKNVLGNPDIASNYFQWNWPPSPAAGFDAALLNGSSSNLIVEYEFMEQVLAGNIETQPDVYSFSLPGYSGSFVINRSGQVIFRDYTDWRITVHWNNIPFPADPAAGWAAGNLYDITGFTLTDPAGNVYEFGQSAGEDQSLHAHREYTSFYTEIITPSPSGPNQTQFRYNSSWYLRKIISAGGAEIIELENALVHQVPGVPANVNPFSNQFNASSDDAVVFPSETTPDVCCPGIYSASAGNGLGAGGNQSIYNRRYLKSATLSVGGEPAERLFFHAGPVPVPPDIYQYGPRSSDIRLDSVTVQRRWKGSWENALGFRFGYDLSTGRLTLKSMRESSPDGAVQKPAWQFDYNPGELPSTTSEAVDYWGYYNGQHSNTTLVPRITLGANNFNPGGANRKAYFQSTGILKSIQYPTGGRTELEYEGHTIPEELPNSDLGTNIGGYRIRYITDYTETGAQGQSRTFQYKMPDGASSGLLLQQMKAYELTYHTNFENPDIGCLNSTTLGSVDPCVCRQYSCSSITIFASGVGPYSFVQGNHIGYSRVEEIIGEPQEAFNIGKNVYWFENSPVGNELWDVSNGKLKKMEIWDKSRKIKETAYTPSLLLAALTPVALK